MPSLLPQNYVLNEYIPYRMCESKDLAAGTGPAPSPCLEVGGDGKAGSHGRIDKIYIDRLHLLQELLVHEIGNSVLLKEFIIFFWLIQSHAQGGPGSAALSEENPDNRVFLLVLEEFLDLFICLFSYLQHYNLLLVLDERKNYS